MEFATQHFAQSPHSIVSKIRRLLMQYARILYYFSVIYQTPLFVLNPLSR